MSDRGFTRFAALVAVLVLATAAPALAQTPTCDVYCGPQGQVMGDFGGGGQDDVIPPPAQPAPAGGGEAPDRPAPARSVPVERGVDAPTPSVSKGSLPFTGFETGLVALLGVALVGAGFAMRRGSRSPA